MSYLQYLLSVIYLLVYFTRLITNIFENQLLPWIYDISSEGKIVLKTEKDKVEKEKNDLQERLEKEREKRIKAQAELRERDNREIEEAVEKMEIESGTKSEDSDILDLDFEKIFTEYSPEQLKTVLDKVLNQYGFGSKDENIGLVREMTRKGLLELKNKEEKRGITYRYYLITKRGRKFLDKFL